MHDCMCISWRNIQEHIVCERLTQSFNIAYTYDCCNLVGFENIFQNPTTLSVAKSLLA